MSAWTFQDIPDQTGRVAVITGANTGIGFETARMLAQKGASVVLACRSAEKGNAAVARIQESKPAGRASFAELDLSDLASVASFAKSFSAANEKLDLLINNAGVMVPPLGRTKQGFELQFGTNHLGHAALTAQLLPLVQRADAGRVVVVSSGVHHYGKIDFDDLNWESRSYNAWKAYAQSKLANLLFALELHRRLAAKGSKVRVTAAHPGYTATDLQRTATLARLMNPLFGMKPADGALPTLRAATDPGAESGSYWGPAHLMEMSGPPVRARISRRAQDEADALRLWSVTEKLTGVAFDLGASPAIPRESAA